MVRFLLAILFTFICLASPVSAASRSAYGGRLEVSAQITPKRTVVVDELGNIKTIYSNTTIDVEPSVRIDTIKGTKTSLSPSQARQFRYWTKNGYIEGSGIYVASSLPKMPLDQAKPGRDISNQLQSSVQSMFSPNITL